MAHFLSPSPIDRQSADRERENELVTDDSQREQGQEAEGRKEILRQVWFRLFPFFFVGLPLVLKVILVSWHVY